VHFLHVRSPEPGALPLVISHGYPSSIVELLSVIGPLTDPRAHGGDPADAFHVVAPSLPGFGFSTPVRDTGWDVTRIARIFAMLMSGVGYERYGAQGGDIGAGVSASLGSVAAVAVLGPPIALPAEGSPEMEALSEVERRRLRRAHHIQTEGKGYLQIQSTRPQTLAYALNDSPTGQLAWIVEKFKEWTNPSSALPDGVDRDDLLTNVSLYWFTGTGASAARFIYEAAHAQQDWSAASPTVTGFAAFDADDSIRRMVDPERKIEHWSEFDRGGHFPHMEVPELLVGDVRRFFRGLR
jgi:pimeloyl-ACP methyl ester carboxylesterase